MPARSVSGRGEGAFIWLRSKMARRGRQQMYCVSLLLDNTAALTLVPPAGDERLHCGDKQAEYHGAYHVDGQIHI